MRKNVIIDIIQKGLDPRVAHHAIGKDGTLVSHVKHVSHEKHEVVEQLSVEPTDENVSVVVQEETKSEPNEMLEVTEQASHSEESTESKKKNALKSLKKKS